MSDVIEIKGLENFKRGLKDWPQKVAKRVLAKAVKYAAFILEEEVKRRVPIDTGQLKDSIGTKRKNISPWEVAVQVQTQIKSGMKHNFWYAPLVEYGSNYVIKRGKRVIAAGRIPPRPYMRPAFDAQRENMQQIIADELSEAATKEWRKLNG